MKFSYNWLQSFFNKKLPEPKKLAELLTMHSFEVSAVEKSGKDYILDIDVLPNRAPDCFSHIGIAREIAAILNCKLQIANGKLSEDKNSRAKDFLSVEVKDKIACPRYTARIVCDVKVGPSPKWIQERLKICGLRPINNIVDIANYVMLETGQPLHAFDLDKLEGVNPKPQILNKPKKIIVRFAKEREKIVTLDEEKYDLNNEILVIADSKNPLAIAGIKGGLMAEITKLTKIIVIESANFAPRVVRKGSKKLGLKTDASWRFEHGIDPNLTEFAINRAADLIRQIAHLHGRYPKVASGLVDIYSKKVLPKKIKLDLAYIERLLGAKIPQKEIIKILTRLGLKIENWKLKILNVVVPTFRLDISLPEDLIEEIGRIYGYQKIKADFPAVSLRPFKINEAIFWENKVKDILKEVGFCEVYNYSFLGEREKEIFGFEEKFIEVLNPVSVFSKYLRPSLIPNLLKNVKENMDSFDKIKIFELGTIFKKTSNKNHSEKKALAGLIFNKIAPEELFYEIKGICDLIFERLGIASVWYDEFKPTPEDSPFLIWHPKKCAEIKVDHREVGFLGEISPKILNTLKIRNKIILFDIDFEELIKVSAKEQEYQPISQYPAAIRDLAVLVPRDVRVEEILNKIENVSGPLVRDVDLFDIYEGEEIPEGKKNLAFHIIYQSEDRTLKSEEIEEIQQKIIKTLEENPEWEVRR